MYVDFGPTGSNVYLGGSIGDGSKYEMAIMRLTSTGSFQQGVSFKAWKGDLNNEGEFPFVQHFHTD